ncbi:hypothetical protein D7316_05459 [Gordonia insulae]|uniref:Uncharacterized protein n=1 Tax=Gordonia insulae TaxID=2420509 RepID=A0A3G8JVB1_9ACTN|nr:hypothetical protein D7316_05459 [Gordonia insulae]
MALTQSHCLIPRNTPISPIHLCFLSMWDANRCGLTLDVRRSYREGVMQDQNLVVIGRRVVA